MRHTVTWLSPHPGETIAYSGHCEQDQHGRPIAAHFNWSPQHLPEAADRWSTHYLVRVAMHELTHALVFSAPLLDHFPGVGGSHCPLVTTPASRWRVTTPRTHVTPPLPGAITTVATPSGGEALAIRTPHVLRAARAHFGCPRLQGAHQNMWLQDCGVACNPVHRTGCNPTRTGCNPTRPGCNPCVQAASLCASRCAARGRRRGGHRGLPLGDAMVQR